MFSYQVYKLVHLASVFFFLGTLGASFFIKEQAKLIKILTVLVVNGWFALKISTHPENKKVPAVPY